MSHMSCFPPELLTQPAETRLNYFLNQTIAHPKLVEARDKLLDAVQQKARTPLIFVYGPTGVGKTTLGKKVQQQMIAAAQAELGQDPGPIPVAGIELRAPVSGVFSWQGCFEDALQALHEPHIADKIDYATRFVQPKPDGRLYIRRTANVTDLRIAFESALRQRQLNVFFFDEAQHFSKVVSGRRLLDQMDALKSMANLTDTVFVLVGTYELLELTNLSAQLSRRSADIHFGRYQLQLDEERQQFVNVLWTFQQHLPLAQAPDLVNRYEYFYEYSAGCVGILKDWLSRALEATLQQGQERLTPACLQETALRTGKLYEVAREIHYGEALLAETEVRRQEVRMLLGLVPAPKSRPAIAPEHPTPPGQRKAKRDPVGMEVEK